MKKRVLVVYTGGTIGMKPSDKGLVPEKGYLDKKIVEILEYELTKVEMPEVVVEEFDPLIDSSDIDINGINQIADTILKNKDDYSGFLVLHGTDTMAYTASALSFLLANLDKPVVVTGSQIPFSQFRSDGRNNLLNAMFIASNISVNEVSLFFNDKLLRGSRATKYITDGFDAFASLNCDVLADVGVQIKIQKNYSKTSRISGFENLQLSEKNIELLHLYPGYNYKNLEFYKQMNLDALVIAGFGVGNVPTHAAFQQAMQELLDAGVKIVLKSQCPVGDMAIRTYEGGHILSEMGVLSCGSMTIESTMVKLNLLLTLGIEGRGFNLLWDQDLVGELS